MMFVPLSIALLFFSSTVLGENCPKGFVKHDENCYKAFNETLSWHDARQACAKLSGDYDLAIVNTQELFEFLKEYDSHWIGLYSPKEKQEFQWVDGTALDFGKKLEGKPWSAIEPNEFGFQESCVHNKAGGLWADTLCGAEYNYICGPAGQEWCQFISKYECQDEFVYTKCPETCATSYPDRPQPGSEDLE